jgi:DNA replication protein DnaC
MPYSREVYSAAESKLADRKRKAEQENEHLKNVLYEKLPRLKKIEDELAQTGIKAAQEILSFPSNIENKIQQLKDKNLSLQAERAELLTENSLDIHMLDVMYQCDKCKDTGNKDGKLCECFKALLKEEACRLANVGSLLPLSTFESFSLKYYREDRVEEYGITAHEQMKRIFTYCKKYASNLSDGKENILMLGQTGLGKTHLALAIANSAAAQGLAVIYDTAQNIFSKMEDENFGRSEKRYTPLVLDCDLLILDDIGAEFVTNYTISALYNIINTRILSHKPIIISTNLAKSELTTKYNERIVSRLIGEFTMLRFFGEDIRQLKLRIQS